MSFCNASAQLRRTYIYVFKTVVKLTWMQLDGTCRNYYFEIVIPATTWRICKSVHEEQSYLIGPWTDQSSTNQMEKNIGKGEMMDSSNRWTSTFQIGKISLPDEKPRISELPVTCDQFFALQENFQWQIYTRFWGRCRLNLCALVF